MASSRKSMTVRSLSETAAGRRVLVVAHGTTLRAFAVILGAMEPDEAEAVEIPNAEPVVYELDAGLRCRSVGLRPWPE
jgi:2,3-bisphosphoglycerate-dependent phosphoglycerate mutase